MNTHQIRSQALRPLLRPGSSYCDPILPKTGRFVETPHRDPLLRRSAGWPSLSLLLILVQTLLGFLTAAQSASSNPTESRYSDRTDSVEHKLRQLEQAWKRKDYVLARALAASVRETLQFEQQEEASIGKVAVPAAASLPVSQLPKP